MTATPKHTYESLEVGDSFSFSRVITAEDVQAFADLSGDDNPIHINPEYAAGTQFGEPIVHGVFLLAVMSKVLGIDFPGHGSIAVSISTKFLRHVPVGNEITVKVKVAEKLERHQHVRIKAMVYREDGKLACAGEAVVIPPKA